ncbi:hypothetical protein ACHAXS_003894 [Conticribra weissflogii]
MHLSIDIIGDAFADIYFYLEGDMPTHGGDARLARPVHTVAGGSGLNTATHLSSLLRHFWIESNNKTGRGSFHVSLQTTVNENDEHGRLIVDHTREHQFSLINRRVSNHPSCFLGFNDSTNIHRQRGEKSTGHCAVIVSKGDRSFMTHLGCMEDFEGSHILAHSIDPIGGEKNVFSRRHVHISGYYNLAGFWNGALANKLEEVKKARGTEENPITISLVTQQDATATWDGGLIEVLQHVDFLILSEIETQNIVRYMGESKGDGKVSAMLEFAANFFNKKSPTTHVIVTLGAKGAALLFGGKCIFSQGTKEVDSPVDVTGAGDSFAAGFIYGFLSGLENTTESESNGIEKVALKRGLRWGCANGTCSVMVQGASVPPSKRSIMEMLDE